MGLLALLHGLQHVYISALPPLYLLLRADFSVSTFQIGLLGSVYGVISILQGPAGYLVERFGGKRLAVLSMLSCSVGIFLYSLAPSFGFFLVIAAFFALGQVFSAPLIGYLIDTLGIRTAFLACSVFPIISIVILLVFRKMRSD